MPSVRSLFHSLSAAVGVSALVLLTGCQGGSTPPETSTTTAPPASSAAAPESPTPAPTSSGAYKPADANGKAQNVPVPVMPALAKENSKEGLEAFIGYWFQLLSYAYETGDTTRVTAVTSADCSFCSSLIDSIRSNTRDGRWMVGGKITVPVSEPLWVQTAPSQQAKVQIVQTSIDYFDSKDTHGQRQSPAINDAAAFVASFEHNAWRVTDMGLLR